MSLYSRHQAAADSQIRHRIFVRWKSAEKIRIAEFAAKFYPSKICGKKYGYSNNKAKSTFQ